MQSGQAVGLDMDEMQELRASVTAATWNQQASTLLAAVSALKAAAAGANQQAVAQHAAQQPQQQLPEQQTAVSATQHAELPANPATGNGSTQIDAAVAQQEMARADGTASAAEQQQMQQEGMSEQLSLWQRIAAAEAAAAEAADRAEAQLSTAATAGAKHQSAVSQDQHQVALTTCVA
jgi:hypothetical protein